MWLLDVNRPRKLTDILGDFGILAETAGTRGWDALTNGALVEAAVAAGFDCVLIRGPIQPVPGRLIRWPSA